MHVGGGHDTVPGLRGVVAAAGLGEAARLRSGTASAATTGQPTAINSTSKTKVESGGIAPG